MRHPYETALWLISLERPKFWPLLKALDRVDVLAARYLPRARA